MGYFIYSCLTSLFKKVQNKTIAASMGSVLCGASSILLPVIFVLFVYMDFCLELLRAVDANHVEESASTHAARIVFDLP